MWQRGTSTCHLAAHVSATAAGAKFSATRISECSASSSGNLPREEPVTIVDEGEQTRDFLYIDDMVEGWVRVLQNPIANRCVPNLGSGPLLSLSINQLAESAIAGFRRPAPQAQGGAPSGPARQAAHGARGHRAGKTGSGWEPRTKF